VEDLSETPQEPQFMVWTFRLIAALWFPMDPGPVMRHTMQHLRGWQDMQRLASILHWLPPEPGQVNFTSELPQTKQGYFFWHSALDIGGVAAATYSKGVTEISQ
jgi:hypothetical protein